MKQRAPSVFAVGALVLLAGGIGYVTGRSTAEPRVAKQMEYHENAAVIRQSFAAYGRVPIVQDAIRRWTPKNGGTVEKAMAGYQVQLVELPTLSCVKFAAIGYDVGGEPVYCYAPRTNRLVWDHSNVE